MIEQTINFIAIKALVANAAFSMSNDDISTLQWYSEDIPRPTDNEILTKASEILAQYEANEYQRQREIDYPAIKDQLDMLYHDIKNGTLETGTWVQAIEEVKLQYPKP